METGEADTRGSYLTIAEYPVKTYFYPLSLQESGLTDSWFFVVVGAFICKARKHRTAREKQQFKRLRAGHLSKHRAEALRDKRDIFFTYLGAYKRIKDFQTFPHMEGDIHYSGLCHLVSTPVPIFRVTLLSSTIVTILIISCTILNVRLAVEL
ncbi:F-box only protein 48 isoform X3 [Numida meleagris]|uniref:F-box only protein 48 isoform X3 n=1 Tax=Numida meleagris TaxID=8996 RepID=UPI000B3E00A4|nr:F-box only protein 48 isoform X3 [Numida meleagris]